MTAIAIAAWALLIATAIACPVIARRLERRGQDKADRLADLEQPAPGDPGWLRPGE